MIVPQKVDIKEQKVISGNIGREVFQEAIFYYKAALILEEQKKEELFPPVLTNALFACELFSKAILYKREDVKLLRQHSLKKLYDKFDEKDKQCLEAYLSPLSSTRIEEFIDDIASMFEFWRYRYERKTYSTHYIFVMHYMGALRKVAETVYDKVS